MKLFGLSMTAMLLFACGEKEETTEPSTEPATEPSGEPSEEVVDGDEDGVPAEEDCNDDDATMPNDDADCDGILTEDDCDDEDETSNSLAEDGDCDGVLTADDCDDSDADSTVVAEDADCDGILTADDCDDDNAGSNPIANDADCDGVLTEEDCNDDDPNSTIRATDGDCDGIETLDDCDDADVNLGAIAEDGDCDGTLEVDDCDDTDANSTIIADDADCDGVLTADDCDDTTGDLGAIADDADCDEVLTADDCDDSDPTSTTVATDGDCDTVLTADDCDDGDANSTTVATDGDCDGTLTADDCDDSDANSTIVADDGDCDTILTADDCDDGDANSTTVATDGDCDGTLTADDCDDTDSSSTIVADDADCDGSLTNDDCDDSDPNVNPAAPEIWYNGVDDDCSGNVSDYDQDSDGEDSVDHGGNDCNDTDANALSNTYYMDADSDGYGDTSSSVSDCTAPTGYVDNDLDCNDDLNNGGAAINPDATEVCDGGIDNDCNGQADDNDTGLDTSTGTTYYADADGDDFGDASNFVMTCEDPSDLQVLVYVTDNTDCDDAEANAYPGAAGNDSTFDCMLDADGDGYGDVNATGNVTAGTDCDDSDGAINPVATETYYDGVDANCDGLSDNDADMDGVDSAAHGGIDCDDNDGNTIGDADGDGFTHCTDDCNDDPATGGTAINPDADEVCDDIDNDCDGDIDDDDVNLDSSTGTEYFADLDGDGQGDASNSGMFCEMPSDHIDNDTDCDDSDEFTFLGAADLDDVNVCMTDADEDGYGDANATGNVVAGTDCDDAEAATNPGVTDDGTSIEDGVDNNCNGFIDEDAFLDISVLSPGDLIITEIMPDPTAVSDANGEWFEIYNDTGVGLNLDGLGFMDDGSDDFTVSGDLYLPADSYLVMAKNADSATNGGFTADYEYGSEMGLTNSSDEIHVYTPSDFIDSVAWDNGATFPNPAGATIALDPGTSATDNDSGFNWCEGTAPYGDGDLGTPGAENDACPPPLTWTTDIQPILQSYSCTGCHSSRMPNLSTILGVQAGDRSGINSGANMPWITPGDPSQSYLLHKINGTQGSVGGGGGTMPSGGSVSQSDIDTIELWINQGAN